MKMVQWEYQGKIVELHRNIDPPRHLISRTGGQASKQINLKDTLKFSRNGELLCGAWLLKSFEQREGQRIPSYSRNRVEIEA